MLIIATPVVARCSSASQTKLLRIMKTESWTIEISPKTKLLNFNWKELIEYRDLVFLLVKRDFITSYRQTALGPLWHLIQPLLTSLTMIIVFLRIANMKINTDVAPAIYFMSAIIAWNFFATTLNKCSSVFIQNASVFGKVFFPRLVVPIAYVFSGVIGFLFQAFFLGVVALGLYVASGYPIHVSYYILFTPFVLLALGIQGMSIGMIISSVTVKYRDFVYLVSFGIQLLMYLSPVIYTMQSITAPKLKNLMMLNPMAPFIEMFRYSITGVGEVNTTSILVSIGITCIMFFVAIIVFNKTEKNFIDTI